MQDLYSLLEVSRRASSEEIKAAYLALVKRTHPDVNAGDKEAERRTKEYNRAYEILSDPGARAAYDLEMGRLRTKARRSFWNAAAAGAATFIVTAGIFSLTMKWRQHAEIHQFPGAGPVLVSRSANNETLSAKGFTDDRVSPSVMLPDSHGSDARSKPVGAPLAGLSGSPPRPDLGVASTTGDDRGTPSVEAPTKGARASSSDPPTAGQISQERPGAPTPARDEPQHTQRANVSPPEVGAKQLMPTPDLPPAAHADVDRDNPPRKPLNAPLPAPSDEPPRSISSEAADANLRDGKVETPGEPAVQSSAMLDAPPTGPRALLPEPPQHIPAEGEPQHSQQTGGSPPETAAKQHLAPIGGIQKRAKRHLSIAEIRRVTMPSRPQGPDRGRGLISSSAMAMRFPSADEPYVNLGTRNK
jgi:hypothetical protein